MVMFILYNLYILVLIQHGYLANKIFTLNPSNSVLKRLFVCVKVLWPSQPNGVMLSAVSLPNHMFTGQT